MDAPDTLYPDPAAYVFTRLQTVLAVENIISLHDYEYAMHCRGVVESHDFWEMVYADSGSLILPMCEMANVDRRERRSYKA